MDKPIPEEIDEELAALLDEDDDFLMFEDDKQKKSAYKDTSVKKSSTFKPHSINKNVDAN